MKKIIFIVILFTFTANGETPVKWQIFFTAPSGKSENLITPDKGLINALRNSKESICGAFYDISSVKISDEFIAASRRGVDVKIVTEKDNYSGKAVNSLIEAGIPVIKDTGSGFMHNKFAVIDREIVFTGSYNITENGSGRNNNNAILIHSRDLAGIFLTEFDEMFQHKIFGNRQEPGAFASFKKSGKIITPDISMEALFSPEDNIENRILDEIGKAEKSILFMAFSFTSREISEVMIRKFREGIDIRGLFEKKGAYTKYSEFIKMKLEGLPVKVDKNRYNMHHKVIIIDNYRVITGSYNFSKNASMRNDENILIIDNADAAELYTEEFNRLYYLKR
jgi:phosphatidylserine/phosphatidylglycerophosphate/cardiolipin synthase-like enzyme